MKRSVILLVAAFALSTFSGCASGAVLRGPTHSVVAQAVDAYESAGHECEQRGNLAVCDLNRPGQVTVVLGYNDRASRLGFLAVAPAKALGKDCASLAPVLQSVPRPAWMTVKCDFVDDNKREQGVIIAGTDAVPERGLSRAEFNVVASQFVKEAEKYLDRVAEHRPATTMPDSAEVKTTQM
jgi:hypothetical protein